MPRGAKTALSVYQQFLKHYLVTGNVSGSAKAINIPVATGYELRDKALKDRVFLKARESIRAKLEPEAEQMAMCCMQLCMERLNIDPEAVLAKLTAAAEPKSSKAKSVSSRVQYQDAGPAYAASFAKLYAALIGAKRFEAEKAGEVPTERSVTIRVQGPKGQKVDVGAD